MPFTFSHPAIVLPLTLLPRQWFSLTGLVVGSLTPDFEYFLRMKVKSDYSHTISGVFWFDLPLGFLLVFLFHNIVRNSLFENLPLILKSRLSSFKSLNWNIYFKSNWFLVAISIVIGSTSHLLWDSFTHDQGYFVGAFPTLATTVKLFNRQIPIFKILQHSSTVIGGIIIIIAIFNLPTDENVKYKSNLKYWIVLATMTLMIIALRLLSGLKFKMYGHLVVTAIAATLISLTLTPLLTRQKE